MSDTLTGQQASAALPGWRLLGSRLHLTVATPDFATALRLVERIGVLAEEQQHHPDIDLRWGRVHVATSSHDVGGITERDVVLGRSITAALDELGLEADPHRLTALEVAIDAIDIPAVLPFWAAILGYDLDDVELTDPDALLPAVWFQQMDAPRPQRNRIHLDVLVAHDEAETRMARALKAGGHLVSDSHAPAFWVLADAEGNEACICTWQGRDASAAATS
jgi:4a-hydroxytetrahydrobiopterin dehydratase